MTDSNREILVVGGGTAGWLTALILQSSLPVSRTGPVEITVMEPSSIGRIGVGEATIPSLKQTLSRLNLSEIDFLKHTNATFKHGIRFVDWRYSPDKGSDTYYHLFERNVSANFERFSPYIPADMSRRIFDIPVNDISSILGAGDIGSRYTEFLGVQAALCNRMLPPKTPDMPDFDGMVQYAYHLDAEALVDWLRSVGSERGIRRVDATVDDVVLGTDSNILEVITKEGQRISADFFVDCSGFRSILMRKALGARFVPFTDHLLCDRAAAIRMDPRPGEARPFTTATARRHGWTWDLDLMNRRGMGYVFSSAHLSDDSAEDLLRSVAGSAAETAEVRFLPMEVGRLEEFWIGNCAAIGLAAGFVEPLESSGIFLIESAAFQLAETLVFSDNGASAREYSRRMRRVYDDIVDFIVLHYVLSERQDTEFWRDASAPSRLTESLHEKLEMWRVREPNASDYGDALKMFSFESFRSILYGMGRVPNLLGAANQDVASNLLRSVRQAESRSVSQLLGHKETIQAIIAGSSSPNMTPLVSDGGIDLAESKHPILVRSHDPDLERVMLSSGTILASEANLENYISEARVPIQDWRPLTDMEIERTCAVSGTPMGQLIEIVKFPEESTIDRIRNLFSDSNQDVDKIVSSEVFKSALANLLREITPYCEGECRCLGVISNPAGSTSVTRQGPQEPLIGLHLDSWSRTVIGDRNDVPNRLCINLGSAARFLLFAPIPIKEMAVATDMASELVDRMNPTDVGRVYMAQHPDTPILRVRLEPGEGYIAPTENVIHDGATTNAPDISLTFLGRFHSFIDSQAGVSDAHQK